MENFIEKIVVIGSSRGLGKAICEELLADSSLGALACVARKKPLLEANQQDWQQRFGKAIEVFSLDCAQIESVAKLLVAVLEFQPTRIIYVAGGGPYGPYHKKNWKDHEWALNLNFIFPAKMLHDLMGLKDKGELLGLKQVCIVGSAVAGNEPDPGAASYAAAKHALRGLITTLQAEQSSGLDIRLFSPGYINTSMLPPGAKPRVLGLPIQEASDVARELWGSLRAIP